MIKLLMSDVHLLGSVNRLPLLSQVKVHLPCFIPSHSKVDKVYTLESSHTPFISMPDKLAAILITESK